eukprot:SAG11_NODE_501_length_8895_cov_12.129832_3_plen_117_part_00
MGSRERSTSDLIEQVQALVEAHHHGTSRAVPASEQRLLYNGRQLQPGELLEDCGITPTAEGNVYLVRRLRGGARLACGSSHCVVDARLFSMMEKDWMRFDATIRAHVASWPAARCL